MRCLLLGGALGASVSFAYSNESGDEVYSGQDNIYDTWESCGTDCDYCDDDCDESGAPPVTYQPSIDSERLENTCKSGVWMPEDPILYRPMIADPRQICYSAGWRFDDQVLVKNVIDVSFGDYFPVYRWVHLGPWDGELELDLDGAVWAVFDPLHESSPLINADYYGGLSLNYAFSTWEFRLRGYHISSHIGDEYLIDHPDFDRRNASAEYVDFFASNDITDEIRLYAGIGYIIAMDREFKCSRLYVEAGTEVRFSGLGFYAKCSNLYGEPFLAMHFRWKKDFKHHLDQTYALGYELGKTVGLCRKLRFLVEYHDGYSLEGQFCKLPTNYLSVRAQYGF